MGSCSPRGDYFPTPGRTSANARAMAAMPIYLVRNTSASHFFQAQSCECSAPSIPANENTENLSVLILLRKPGYGIQWENSVSKGTSKSLETSLWVCVPQCACPWSSTCLKVLLPTPHFAATGPEKEHLDYLYMKSGRFEVWECQWGAECGSEQGNAGGNHP